jgi:hypothetical protein
VLHEEFGCLLVVVSVFTVICVGTATLTLTFTIATGISVTQGAAIIVFD